MSMPSAPPMLTRRAGAAISWQTMLADLALILFMVTAAAMGQSPDKPPAPSALPQATLPAPPQTALAIWRERDGAASLGAWLSTEAADPRQQLTLTLRYRPGALEPALAHARVLAASAGAQARAVRIVIAPMTEEPDTHVGEGASQPITARATLDYDRR